MHSSPDNSPAACFSCGSLVTAAFNVIVKGVMAVVSVAGPMCVVLGYAVHLKPAGWWGGEADVDHDFGKCFVCSNHYALFCVL